MVVWMVHFGLHCSEYQLILMVVWNMAFIFTSSWEKSQHTFIFFRGVGQPPTSEA
jgi:hypothetical protein